VSSIRYSRKTVSLRIKCISCNKHAVIMSMAMPGGFYSEKGSLIQLKPTERAFSYFCTTGHYTWLVVNVAMNKKSKDNESKSP
jgi:hypothetical protein